MSDPVEPQQAPTSRLRKRDVSRTYTGPERSTLPTRSQQEKYFQRVANENILPTRAHKWLGFGGWIFGGSETFYGKRVLIAVACGYMVLFADFGDREHVFSPVSDLVLPESDMAGTPSF